MHANETRERALSEVRNGKTTAEVAQALRIPESTVARWRVEAKAKAGKPAASGKPGKAKARAGKPGKRRPAAVMNKLREQARELRAKGKTITEIVERLNVSPSTAARWKLPAAGKPSKPAKPAAARANGHANGNGHAAAPLGPYSELQRRYDCVVIERDALRAMVARLNA